jgi:hypothetical protein
MHAKVVVIALCQGQTGKHCSFIDAVAGSVFDQAQSDVRSDAIY